MDLQVSCFYKRWESRRVCWTTYCLEQGSKNFHWSFKAVSSRASHRLTALGQWTTSLLWLLFRNTTWKEKKNHNMGWKILSPVIHFCNPITFELDFVTCEYIHIILSEPCQRKDNSALVYWNILEKLHLLAHLEILLISTVFPLCLCRFSDCIRNILNLSTSHVFSFFNNNCAKLILAKLLEKTLKET